MKEADRPDKEIKEKKQSAAMVVVRCPNCMEDIVLHPKLSSHDYNYSRGAEGIGYKKGSRECPCCGKRVDPLLSVEAVDQESTHDN